MRNAVRIVCNPDTGSISYFFRNEMGEWMVLTGSSPLSRRYYTRTTIEERHKDIVEKLDEIYNRKNKGLDIFFEGTSANYNFIAGAVKKYLPGRDIVCKLKVTKIAVVGKKGSGKSTLIEGIAREKGDSFEIKASEKCKRYIDKNNNIEWIELRGIAFSAIQDLAREDLSTVIYCVSGDVGRIEDKEKEFIEKIRTSLSPVKVLTVLTKCYKEEVQKILDEIEKLTNHVEAFPVLAKEYKASEREHAMAASYVVAPFGLKELCAFVFEGKKLQRQFQNELKTATTYIAPKKGKPDGGEEKKTVETGKIVVPKPVRDNSPQEKRQTAQVTVTKPADLPEKKPVFRKIAVVGKIGVGKTTLIEEMGNHAGRSFRKTDGRGYTLYEDQKSSLQWYEVKGIDLGRDKVEAAYRTVKELAADGLNTIFYCMPGGIGRIEDLEADFVRRLTAEYPGGSVVIVLTMCYKEEGDIQDTINEVKKRFGKTEIVQILARDYKTRIKIPATGENRIVPAFGLDSICRYADGDK